MTSAIQTHATSTAAAVRASVTRTMRNLSDRRQRRARFVGPAAPLAPAAERAVAGVPRRLGRRPWTSRSPHTTAPAR